MFQPQTETTKVIIPPRTDRKALWLTLLLVSLGVLLLCGGLSVMAQTALAQPSGDQVLSTRPSGQDRPADPAAPSTARCGLKGAGCAC